MNKKYRMRFDLTDLEVLEIKEDAKWYSWHNGCGYDQWRITSTKLSKYDTE
jgi:hypothetical protein